MPGCKVDKQHHNSRYNQQDRKQSTETIAEDIPADISAFGTDCNIRQQAGSVALAGIDFNRNCLAGQGTIQW